MQATMSKWIFTKHITEKCLYQKQTKTPLKIKKMTHNPIEKWTRDFNTNFTERICN